jgi:hypothetical protein
MFALEILLLISACIIILGLVVLVPLVVDRRKKE